MRWVSEEMDFEPPNDWGSNISKEQIRRAVSRKSADEEVEEETVKP